MRIILAFFEKKYLFKNPNPINVYCLLVLLCIIYYYLMIGNLQNIY